MYKDEILAEVWRNRDAYVKKCRHSLDAMVKDIVKRQEKPLTGMADHRATKSTVKPGKIN